MLSINLGWRLAFTCCLLCVSCWCASRDNSLDLPQGQQSEAMEHQNESHCPPSFLPGGQIPCQPAGPVPLHASVNICIVRTESEKFVDSIWAPPVTPIESASSRDPTDTQLHVSTQTWQPHLHTPFIELSSFSPQHQPQLHSPS